MNEHPAAVMMFRFWIPTVLMGIRPTGNFAGKVVLRPTSSDMHDRTKRLGGNSVNLTRGFSAFTFGMALAKIGHSFAAAELGVDGFKPCLNDMLRNIPPFILAHYVGSLPPEETPPDSAERHEIGFEEPYIRYDGQEFIRVRIRLFGDQGMPVHQVVVGQPNIPSPGARPLYVGSPLSRIAGKIRARLRTETTIPPIPHLDRDVPFSNEVPEQDAQSPPSANQGDPPKEWL